MAAAPLEFNRNAFTSNLTSFMAFYAYMILGLDYDSFELEGGTPYFQIAQDILNAVPNGAGAGWTSIEDQRNRYWMIDSKNQCVQQNLPQRHVDTDVCQCQTRRNCRHLYGRTC